MFYANREYNEHLKELFIEKMKKNGNLDLISGFFYTDLPDHLYEIQERML